MHFLFTSNSFGPLGCYGTPSSKSLVESFCYLNSTNVQWRSTVYVWEREQVMALRSMLRQNILDAMMFYFSSDNR